MNDTPMPKRRLNTPTERAGVNRVRALFEAENCAFQEIDARNDIGLDSWIELYDSGLATGIQLSAQIKSGSSYCTAEECFFYASAEQVNYWRSLATPVIAFVYDPNIDRTYWANLKSLVGPHDLSKVASRRITFAKTRINYLEDGWLHNYFLPMALGRCPTLSFETASSLAMSEVYSEHSLGLSCLFYGHIEDIHAWELLIDIASRRDPASIDRSIAYYLAHVPAHGDIFWTKSTSKLLHNAALAEEVAKRMRSLQRPAVLNLVSLIEEENSFERGSVGQSVRAILHMNSDRKYLQEFVEDASLSDHVRWASLLLNAEDRGTDAPDYLRMLTDDPTLGDFATELASHIIDFGPLRLSS